MNRTNNIIIKRKGLTLLEMVIAMAIMIVIMAALLPQIAAVNKSWDSRRQGSEALQNARVLTDHLNRNLAKAVRIIDASEPATVNGFLEFKDNNGDIYRYEVSGSNMVQFGIVGALSDLAGPVSNFQFTCYADTDLDNALTIASDGVDDIRFVKTAITMTNSAALGQDKSLVASAYLRTNYSSGAPIGTVTMGTETNFGDTTGNTPELAQIDATHFLCAFTGTGDDGYATVLTVDTSAKTVASGIALEFDTAAGKHPTLAKIDDFRFLCAYQGSGNDGMAVVLKVNTGVWTITTGATLEYDSQSGVYPDLVQIDQYHYLCVYTGMGGDGWAVILEVIPGTWDVVKHTPFEFDTSACNNPVVVKMDATHYFCTYEGFQQKGYGVILEVDIATWDVAKIDEHQLGYWYYTPALIKIDDGNYLNVFATFYGRAIVFNVDTTAWTADGTPKFKWESAFVGRSAVVSIAGSKDFLCFYTDNSDNLTYTLFNVNTSTDVITETEGASLTSYKSHWPDLMKIDDSNYLCVYENQTNNGWAAIITVNGALKP